MAAGGHLEFWWLDQRWVQSGGPVTTESIVRFDTWFELFEVFRKNLAPMTLAKMADSWGFGKGVATSRGEAVIREVDA